MMKIKLFTHLITKKVHLLASSPLFSIRNQGKFLIIVITNYLILWQNKNEEFLIQSLPKRMISHRFVAKLMEFVLLLPKISKKEASIFGLNDFHRNFSSREFIFQLKMINCGVCLMVTINI